MSAALVRTRAYLTPCCGALGVSYFALAIGLVVGLGLALGTTITTHLVDDLRSLRLTWWVAGLWSYIGWQVYVRKPIGLWLSLLCAPEMALVAMAAKVFGANADALAWLVVGLTPIQIVLQILVTGGLLVEVARNDCTYSSRRAAPAHRGQHAEG